jgi:hypothetical protein
MHPHFICAALSVVCEREDLGHRRGPSNPPDPMNLPNQKNQKNQRKRKEKKNGKPSPKHPASKTVQEPHQYETQTYDGTPFALAKVVLNMTITEHRVNDGSKLRLKPNLE